MDRKRESVWLVVGACGFGLFLARGLLLEPGWIGLRHDWTPWAFSNELAVLARSEFYAFSQTGLGTPVAYPNDWIVYLPYAVVGSIFNSEVISKGTLVLVPAVAAAGTYVLVRTTLRYSPLAASIAGVFVACSPVMYNRIIAGQLAFLWASALLPWWLGWYRRGETTSRGGIVFLLCTALAAAAVSAQLQFVLFLCILTVCDLLLWRERPLRASIAAAGATVVGMAVAQAGTVAALASRYAALDTGNNIPSLSWVRSNSASLFEALQLRGYVAHYFNSAYSGSPLQGSLTVLGSVCVIAVLIGAATSVRTPCGRFFVAIWVLGVVLSLGLNGPVGHLLTPLYENFRPMQLFREVYHWSTLSNLASGVLLAGVLEYAMRSKAAARGILGACIAVSILYCFPSLDGEWGGNVQTVRLTDELSAAYWKLTAGHGIGRILWLPADQPLALYDGSFAGMDPMAYAPRPALWAYVPDSPMTSIIMNLRSGKERGLGNLLSYTGVQDVVERRELRSQLPDFFFRAYRSMALPYARNANLRGVAKLNWPATYVGRDVAVFRAPKANALLAVANARAYISPSEDFISDLPAGVSPDASAASPIHADLVSLEAADVSSNIAAIGKARDLLRTLPILATDDAQRGWAPFHEWWPYRESYTRIFDASIITLSRGASLEMGNAPSRSMLVVSYVTSPHGGTMLLTCGSVSRRIETLSEETPDTLLKSDVIPIRETCPIRIVNERGEQVLRHIYVLSRGSWDKGERLLTNMEESAAAVRVAIHGPSSILIDRPGVYRVSGVARIDGREVRNDRIELTGGRHRVDGTSACLRRGHLPRPHEDSLVSASSHDNGALFTGLIPAGTRLLVLRSTFSRDWQLRIGADVVHDHGHGDLYGNLWQFASSTHPVRFELVYRPAQIVSRVHLASSVLLAIGIVAAGLLALPHDRGRRVAGATPSSYPWE